MYSYSFSLLKPDCYQRGLTRKVLSIIRRNDFHIVAMRMLILARRDVERIYYDSMNDDYFNRHADFMTSGPVIGLIIGGQYSVQRLNLLVGHTIPAQAASGTIRRLGTDICRNLIHSSDNYHRFVQDSRIVFPDADLENLFSQEYFI